MASLFTNGVFQAQDATGALSGALLYTYAAGDGLTELATYTAQDGLSENENPVECDSNGQAHVWLGPDAYRMILKTSAGVTVWDEDNISAPLTTADLGSIFGVSVLRYIPPAYHAAILDRTTTVDVTEYINECIEANAITFMPAGTYLTRYPINLSARGHATNYRGRRLIGAGVGNTIINAYTSNYPAIDCTGNSDGEVSGMNIRSDSAAITGNAAHCASIGIMLGRGLVAAQSNEFKVNNVRINLHSDMTRNDSKGTIGICNEGAEHVIGDAVELYANIPLVEHSELQFDVSRSCDIVTIGDDFEEPATSFSSCTVHEWSNMVLVALDSFRAYWGYQVAGVAMPSLYTSTRYVADLTPSYAETFCFQGAASNITIDCYQETSGLFTSTYKQDHRYITFVGGGSYYENMDIKVQRGALDHVFTEPGSPSSSIHFETGATVTNSTFNCNYLISTYVASSDSNGFAAVPVSWGGTPVVRNVDFILDHSTTGRGANIFVTGFGAFCTNVTSTNWRSGKTMRSDQTNLWTPTVIGLSAAGTGTYSALRSGKFERVGQWCMFTGSVGWSNHTGTGQLAISGLPYTADADQNFAVEVYADGLVVGAGYQLVGWIAAGSTVIRLRRLLDTGAAIDGVAMDTAVTEVTVTGRYRITDVE